MKYIDAEKLKEELYEVYQDWLNDSTVLETELDAVKCVLDSIDDTIDSLQQEQPTNTDNLCSELADFLRKNDIQEDKAKFLANRIADEYGSKRYVEGLCDRFKQEQSEVDLEKEIKDTCRGYRINESHEQELGKRDIENIAQYFFELGLKAKGE